jgi:hypothetical protein
MGAECVPPDDLLLVMYVSWITHRGRAWGCTLRWLF